MAEQGKLKGRFPVDGSDKAGYRRIFARFRGAWGVRECEREGE
jgi:hypothetical protein